MNEAVAREGLGVTDRRDAWWAAPFAVAAGLGILGLYLTWAAAQNAHFRFGGYLSPLYSPEIHAPWWPLSPAFLILIPPILFRTTCYYYRKAYYRSFFWIRRPARWVNCTTASTRARPSSPSCSRTCIASRFYLAFLWLFFLWYDVWKALWFDGKFGIGLGTLVILASTGTLTLYTFSCHSWRHLVGGKLDCFSCSAAAKTRHGIWGRVTRLNEHHSCSPGSRSSR